MSMCCQDCVSANNSSLSYSLPRRLESLLESYYGMQDEEAAAKDAHDMDSSAFSVAEVASDVVASKSLPELLTYKDGIERQTRHLDHEMQQLVYNNYNRFISATDTIRKMKTSVAEMESKMDTLVTDMRQMGGSSELVNESLQENRGKIEKLVGVKRLLVKLEFLFELPVRLKRAIELDAQGQAVRYYSMVIGVLRKHDHIPSLHKIRVEADAIINGLRAELRGVLKDSKASTAASSGKVVEAIRLLVQLEEPRPALRAAFLAYQRTRLLASLRQHTARYPPVGGAAPGAAGDKAASGGLPVDVSSASLSMLSATAQAYYSAAVAARSGAGGAAAVGGGAVGAGGVGSGGAAMLSSPRPRASVLPYPWMQQLDRSFIDSFRVAAEMYAELFEGAAATSASSSGSGAGATAGGDGGDASSSGATAAAAAATAVSPEERRAAHEELLAFAKDCFGDYFAVVRGQLSLAPPRPGDAALAGLASPGGGSSPAGGAASSGHAPSASAPSGLGADSKGSRAGAGRRTASTAAGASGGLGAPGSPKLTAGAAAAADADVAAAERAKRDTVAAAMAMSGVGDGSGAAGSAGLTQGSGSGRFDSMVEALKLFLSDVRSASRSVPAARLSDRAQEVTEAVLRAQLDGLFSDVRADVVSGLGRLRAFAGALVDEEKDRAVRAVAGAPLDGETAAVAGAAGGSAEHAPSEGGSGGPAGGAAAGAGGVASATGSGARGAGAALSANPFALPAAGAAAASDAAASAAAASGNPFAAAPAGGAAAAGHARRPSGNPFALGGDAAGDSASAGTASANPFAAPTSSGSGAPPAASAAPSATSSSSSRGKPAAYDWLQVVGSGLSSAAETSSSDVSARIDVALQEAKPLVLSAMRLLPDLARVFNSLVHGQVITLLSWLASAWEAQSDPMHPCRAEFAAVVVEADLGLEREAALQHGGGGGAGGGRNGAGRPPSTTARGGSGGAGGGRPSSVRGAGSASSSASAHASALKRRVIVNFAAAEGGDALGSAAAVTAAGAGGVDARSAADAGAASGAASPSSAAAAAAAAGSAAAGPVGQQAVERQQAFLLLLAVVCRHFATNGVARALSTMLTTLPSRAELATMGLAPSPLSGGPVGGSAGTAAAEDVAGVDSYGAMMDVPDLIRRVQAAGRALLRAYVKGESARLSAVIRRAMTSGDWLRHAEPRGARLFVRLLIEDAAAVRKLVAVTLRDWDARAAVAAALAYGVGSANITAASSGASSSGVSAGQLQQQEGSGVAGGSRRPSSNPFADASAASASRLTATAGNPFAAPAPASAAAPGGPRGSVAGGAVGGSGAGASGTGHNAAVVSAAQAARRTGMVVGALGAPGVSAGGAASTAGPFGGRGFGGAGGGSAASRMGLGMGLGMGASHDIDRLFHTGGGDEGGMLGGAGGGPMTPGGASGGASLVLGWVDYSSASVVRALLRVLCKALVEWVRAVTFGREGFQQMQVDIAALHLALPFLVGTPPPAAGGSGGFAGGGGGSAGGVSLLGYPGSGPGSGGGQHHDPYQGAGQLEELLAEAAVSAAERCLAPAPLEMSIVHALASEMLVGVNLSL